MKKGFLLLFALAMVSIKAIAAAGDTTVLQTHHQGTQLSWYGNYDDSTLKFPNGTKTYSKILMVFTLGKYACPAGSQYCADWDYTVQTFLMPRAGAGDTLELGRSITPYANGLGQTGLNWKYDYVYDVTDFYPVLKDSASLRIHYSGYSGGFTGTIKFLFIEGTPPRTVVGVKKIYSGSFAYGSSTDNIENHLPAVTKTAPAGTTAAAFKLNITGHGSDNTGCSEFCSKYYQVLVNNTMIEQKDIWRNDCGFNEVYPQNGTWIYDRGNWCPGAIVKTNTTVLPGVTSGANYTLNLDLEPYTNSGAASYIVEGNVFYYSVSNYVVDASLEDIVAPTNSSIYFRENPVSIRPTVKIKNNGTTTITSVKFQYGANGSIFQSTWTGSLASRRDTVIDLPVDNSLYYASGTANKYKVIILQVNGSADANIHNDTLSSVFTAAPLYPRNMVVSFKTNLATANGVSENSWKVYDINNNVVAQRINASANTIYSDTLNLGIGAYRLVVSDAGCNGINWWAAASAGSGYITLRNPASAFQTYPASGYFGGDFGCGFTQYFTTAWPTAVEEVTKDRANIVLSPNPAMNSVNVSLQGISTPGGMLMITDVTGRTILQQVSTGSSVDINISSFANGVYSVVYLGGEGNNVKLQSKLVIAR